jgi:GT2 family glycosyltransferase
VSYGGRVRQSSLHPLRLALVNRLDSPQFCQTMNGNCVLVPRAVVDCIGNLDESFRHGLGDWDFGLRASRSGFPIVTAPGFIGACAGGTQRGDAVENFTSMREAWRRISAPKALPPVAWFTYAHRHGGFAWPLFWLKPYAWALARGFLRGGF